MKKKVSPLALLSFVMVINALSYGTIIPLLYPYASRFGVSPLGMSFLFASFSLAQFFSTPILGRLSDKFGRKPILVICLLGTSLSLGTFALANNFFILFVSRFIDGITGGNVSVAQAIISDTAKGADRAKAFGILGASFGFGFIFGPALGGLMSKVSLTAPFWFAAGLALLGAVLAILLLPETLDPALKKIERRESVAELFKLKEIYRALFTPFSGVVLLVSFFLAVSLNAMIIGFQAFTVDVLKLNGTQIGLFFSVFGLIGVGMQFLAIGPVMKRFPSKKNILIVSTTLSAVAMVFAFLSRSFVPFFLAMMAFGMVSVFRDPMISSLLIERTRDEDRGGILGINQAYTSLGQIIGPITAGLVSRVSVSSVFLLSAGYLLISLILSHFLHNHTKEKLDL